MNAQHTPTPWQTYAPMAEHCQIAIESINSETIAIVELMDAKRDYNATAKANAAFIVRACNSHDALVAAATEAENWLSEYESGPDSGLSGLLNQLRAALAAAGEGA